MSNTENHHLAFSYSQIARTSRSSKKRIDVLVIDAIADLAQVLFTGVHCIIDIFSYGWFFGSSLQPGPSRGRWNVENPIRRVFVFILRISSGFCFFRFQFGVVFLEGIRYVFQKDETQYNMFVFGSIYLASQFICCCPKGLF